jgi:beta-hydroxylase
MRITELFRAKNTPGPADPRGKHPFILRNTRKILPKINRIISRYSLIPTTALLDKKHFPWIADVEAQADIIREEALHLLRHQGAIPPLNQISPDHARIGRDGKWRSFFLYGYGFRLEGNCLRAPRTAQIISRIPQLNTAFFSILEPGAHIARHTGVTRGLITCHLGIVVPEKAEDCHMQVGDEHVYWQQGKILTFDDTLPHEVWNETDEIRCVLLIQVKRPLRLPGRLLSDTFLGIVRRTGFVKDARRNLGQWEQAYKMAEMNEQA